MCVKNYLGNNELQNNDLRLLSFFSYVHPPAYIQNSGEKIFAKQINVYISTYNR